MKQENRKQHYIPQIYLRKFSGEDKYIHTFDKATGKSYRATISNICCEDNLYTVWDLNYILGDEFVWNLGQLCTIHVPESSISMKVRKDYPLDFESYQLGNPKATGEILLLWKKWRSNGIEAESVCEMIDRINGTLAASGAYRFEKMCWSLEDPSDSVKNAKDWTKKRFDFLDEVFEYSED